MRPGCGRLSEHMIIMMVGEGGRGRPGCGRWSEHMIIMTVGEGGRGRPDSFILVFEGL